MALEDRGHRPQFGERFNRMSHRSEDGIVLASDLGMWTADGRDLPEVVAFDFTQFAYVNGAGEPLDADTVESLGFDSTLRDVRFLAYPVPLAGVTVTTERGYGDFDHDLVKREVERIVGRYFETPELEEIIIERLHELTVAERVTVFSIFRRLTEITQPPELEDKRAAIEAIVADAVTTAATYRRRCPECDSTKLNLELVVRRATPGAGPVDGRLNQHDLAAVLVLGCDYCSATVEIIDDTSRIQLTPFVGYKSTVYKPCGCMINREDPEWVGCPEHDERSRS